MKIPSSIEEEILNYLRQQEQEQQQNEGDRTPRVPQDSYSYPSDSHNSSYIRTILNELLIAIDRRTRLRREYMKRLREHNQYDLFDLSKTIPNFYIGMLLQNSFNSYFSLIKFQDDEMAEKLCFRETLVIGHLHLEMANAPPNAVGGICLNVQKAKGSHPLDRKIPMFDETPRDDDNCDVTVEEVQEIKDVSRVLSGRYI